MKKIALLLLVAALVNISSGQVLTSEIAGKVVDDFNNMPLPGANVILIHASGQTGTISDENGEFHFNTAPVGRITINVSYIGYEPTRVGNIFISSGKDVFINIELEEMAIEMEEIVISSNPKRNANNQLAFLSARGFDVEATERYAGTNGDPARMATYFAGVMAAGDTRNDIIIRGNSPTGLLWQLEGVDIPNPNHFAAMGTNGGPICILNNNQLQNSDFFTGAFPAQYGNALSGAFDLRLRNGNNQKRETTLQMGTGGLEAGFEGYFSKRSKASYMINYRYAFLGLFQKIGIEFDIPGIPNYQDLSYKLNFPTKKSGSFSVWGLGGKSYMEMIGLESNLNATKNINTLFGSNMGASGISHRLTINENTFYTASFAVTGLKSYLRADSAKTGVPPYTIAGNNNNETKLLSTSLFKHKLNNHFRVIFGHTYTHFFINHLDSIKFGGSFVPTMDFQGNYGLLQLHAQNEYKLNARAKATAGLHYQHLFLNNTKSLEPRFALKYDVNAKTGVQFAYGLHSQIQQSTVYFNKTLADTTNLTYVETNKELDFSKSHHIVAGISHMFSPNLKINLECYYQHLFNIPIETKPSSYSTINYGVDFFAFVEDSLKNNGLGKNKGIEIGIERFYHKGFYYIANISVFGSKYRGSDRVWRNTLFNNNYVANLLGGYEIKLPDNQFLAINANLAWAGGLRYTPVDIEKSIAARETVHKTSEAFSKKHKDYFKMNMKLIYRINHKKLSYETGFGINNLTKRKNVLQQVFDTGKGEMSYDYQLGLMMEGMFRIYF